MSLDIFYILDIYCTVIVVMTLVVKEQDVEFCLKYNLNLKSCLMIFVKLSSEALSQ